MELQIFVTPKVRPFVETSDLSCKHYPRITPKQNSTEKAEIRKLLRIHTHVNKNKTIQRYVNMSEMLCL